MNSRPFAYPLHCARETGIFADPALAAASRQALNELGLLVSKRMLNAMANRQDLDYNDLIEFAVDRPSDLTTLITNHGCKGQALTTFSENLRRVIQALAIYSS